MTPDNRSQATLLLGFALLVALILGSAWLAGQQTQSFALVRHTLEVEGRLSTVLSDFQDAEGGQRSYLLTGQPDYLEPYDAAVSRVDEDIKALGAATADNPRQQVLMGRLRKLGAARLARLSRTLARYRNGDHKGTVTLRELGPGQALTIQIRDVIRAMKAEEARLLQTRERATVRQAGLAQAGLAVNGIVILGLILMTFRQGQTRLRLANSSAAALGAANAALNAELETREAAEAQVRQMQKMESIGQLTGGIAHDFNNMLTIVIGSLDIAKRRLGTDRARALVYIDNALDGANRAATLTARLLAFSRQHPLVPRSLDANKLVGGMSEMLRQTIGEHLRLETVLAGGLWRAFVDPSQLENAVLNLVINARDAMPDGGRLTVETSNAHLDDAYAVANEGAVAGQYVLISITDTGTGMSADVIERVFDPFFTTKGVGKGTGLGLSQVYGFVKQSGGHVKVYSEPGLGTTVKLYLPRHFGAEADPDVAEPLLEAGTGHAKEGEVILVVEDDEKIRFLSIEALRDFGYTVVQAGDASQALAVLAVQARIDLLFTDIVMPGMNGRQLADKARESRPDLKVLYATGFTKNAVVHNGVLDADVALISKPFTIDDLVIKVRLVLDGGGINRGQ
ncbi:MAG: CHASE3 domain-containing protein [Sphingomonas sp.]|nr:CHASE3 domain-containing protein [Sphingomonas sp.]